MDERMSARKHSGLLPPAQAARAGRATTIGSGPNLPLTAITNAIRVGNYLLQRLS